MKYFFLFFIGPLSLFSLMGGELTRLDYGKMTPTLISSRLYEESDGTASRIYEDLVLDSKAGSIRITLSRPKKGKVSSCLFVVAGLETGRKSLQLIPDHGDNLLISFEYPAVIKNIKKKSVLFYLPSIREACLRVPSQINGVLRYIQEKGYCDSTPPSMIAVSFGCAFLPAALHLGQTQDLEYGPTVFGYGGAGIKCVFQAITPGPNWFKKMVGLSGAKFFHPLEPELHLPYIHGKFLVVNGTEDRLIPNKCALNLQRLVPEPKSIINLKTEHLQPDNTELMIHIINISRSWLETARR
ncbi:MAG: hypothetical protein WDZ28_03135 [Simkaniaceae bacterium]